MSAFDQIPHDITNNTVWNIIHRGEQSASETTTQLEGVSNVLKVVVEATRVIYDEWQLTKVNNHFQAHKAVNQALLTLEGVMGTAKELLTALQGNLDGSILLGIKNTEEEEEEKVSSLSNKIVVCDEASCKPRQKKKTISKRGSYSRRSRSLINDPEVIIAPLLNLNVGVRTRRQILEQHKQSMMEQETAQCQVKEQEEEEEDKAVPRRRSRQVRVVRRKGSGACSEDLDFESAYQIHLNSIQEVERLYQVEVPSIFKQRGEFVKRQYSNIRIIPLLSHAELLNVRSLYCALGSQWSVAKLLSISRRSILNVLNILKYRETEKGGEAKQNSSGNEQLQHKKSNSSSCETEAILYCGDEQYEYSDNRHDTHIYLHSPNEGDEDQNDYNFANKPTYSQNFHHEITSEIHLDSFQGGKEDSCYLYL